MQNIEAKTQKLNKLNKVLLKALYVIVGLLIVLLCVAIFYESKIPELPEEFKQEVISIIGENERFIVDDIYLMETGTIQIMLRLDEYPKTDRFIELNVKNFIHQIELKHNYDLDIAIMVYIPIEGTDKVNYLGRGSYYAGGYGKIEFEPAK